MHAQSPYSRPAWVRRFLATSLFIVLGIATPFVRAQSSEQQETVVAAPFFSWKFDPSHALVKIEPIARWGLFRESEAITVRTLVGTTIRVMDWRGNVVYSGKPGRLLQLPVGHYFVEIPGDRTQFAVLPADYHGASFLGTDADLGLDPAQTLRVDNVDPQVVRGGAHWPEVQPTPDTWNWESTDRMIAVNAARHRKILIVANIRPDWLTDDSEFVSRYALFVKRIAKRYGTKIDWLEIWNEMSTPIPFWGRLPYSDSFEAMLRSYVNLAQHSREAIRSVSKVRVAGPSWQNPNVSEDTRKLMALGAKDALDDFTYHDYVMRAAAPDRDTIPSHVLIPRVDKRAGDFRASTGTLPQMVVEMGFYGRSALGIPNTGLPEYSSNLSWQQGVWRTIKTVVMYRAAGVQVMIPHVLPMGTHDPKNNLQIFGWDLDERGPHPKTSALLMTCYWLNGASPIQQRIINDQVFLYGWSRPDGRTMVMAWCTEGNSAKLHPTEAFKMTDIFGQTAKASSLNPEPILFNAPTSTSTQEAMDAVVAMIQPAQ